MRNPKAFALLLVFFLLLSACSPESKISLDEGPAQAKGRYVEQETNFPDFTTVIAVDQVAPDTFYALGTRNGYEPPFEVVCSTDGGVTWQPRAYAGIAELLIYQAAFTPQGGLYALCVEEPESEEPRYATTFINGEEQYPVEHIAQLQEFNFGFVLTPAGEMLLNNHSSIAQLNLETGEVSHQYELDGQTADTLHAFDNRLAVGGEAEILLFDTDTGESLGSIACAQGGGTGRAIAVQPDRSGFYYCQQDGLYRVSMDGALTEQIIDGALTSFGVPSVTVSGLYTCADGSFVVLCTNNRKPQLQRYVFDPDMAREPGRALTLFMLREDPFIQQLIGLYHKSNPDVMVAAHIGVNDGSGVLAADAMRTLSTELLAGKGPDILVLDGLPLDSYRRNGVLADLSDSISQDLGGLLPNVSANFIGRDGGYALPTRISIPVIAGVGIGEIHSVVDLVRYVEAREEKGIGVAPESMMEEFYPMCAARWFRPEGGVDLAAVTEDLTALQRLAVLVDALPEDDGRTIPDSGRAMYWSYDILALVVQLPLRQLKDAAHIYSAIDQRGEGELRLFPDENGGIYLPGSILGVNAAAGNAADAQGFVRFALRREAQASSLDAGTAVTLEGLEAMAGSIEPGAAIAVGMSGNRSTGETYELVSLWPDKDRMDQVIDLLQTAKTPVVLDETIRGMVLSETAGLFAGERTVEQTAHSLTQAVERYMQELG